MRSLIFLFLFVFPALSWSVDRDLCIGIEKYCDSLNGRGHSKPAYPSTSSSVSLNPAAVPVEKSLGLEVLYYKISPDFSLVTGTGRIGAAISPTSGEETFFGNPAFELLPDYFQRQMDRKKYESQKIALATAVTIADNDKSGLDKLSLNLGVQARYNKFTKHISPGVGVSGIAGPLTLGYSYAKDEFAYTDDPTVPSFEYIVNTFSGGLFFKSIALDYSDLMITAPQTSPIHIKLYTGSLLLQRWILTVAKRTEESTRPKFDRETETLTSGDKSYYFGGVQFAIHPKILVGVFYNYYLVDEFDAGITVFAF